MGTLLPDTGHHQKRTRMLTFVFPLLLLGEILCVEELSLPTLKCKNPNGKLWSTVLDKHCGQSVCEKNGRKAAWKRCPRPASEENINNRLDRLEKLVKEETKEVVEKIEKKIEDVFPQSPTPQDITVQLEIIKNTIKGQEEQLKNMKSELGGCRSKNDIQDMSLGRLENAVEEMSNLPGKWSDGSYCILSNGECPDGFTKMSGYLNALNIYSCATNYIKESHFGDSRMTKHGNNCQWGNYAEIAIVACCK